MEKVKTLDFSGRFVACGLKVGRYKQHIELMYRKVGRLVGTVGIYSPFLHYRLVPSLKKNQYWKYR